MTANPSIDDGEILRRVLFEEIRGADEEVRQAAAAADDGSARAVHMYRKALRRARALLRMIEPELPKADRRTIGRALRDARRALGAARDHAVAIEILDQVQGEDERRIARAILDRAAASAPSSAEIKQLLAEGAARTAAQLELLDAVLPARVDWATLVDGVRRTYAQARNARRAAKRSRRAFHTWRRRSKELAIQLEVIARVAAPQLEALHDDIVSATDDLRDAVDLLMARDFVREHGDGLDRKEVDLLARTLARQLDDEIRAARRTARDTFRQKPRELARKLAKAARHGITAVAAPPPPHDEEFAVT